MNLTFLNWVKSWNSKSNISKRSKCWWKKSFIKVNFCNYLSNLYLIVHSTTKIIPIIVHWFCFSPRPLILSCEVQWVTSWKLCMIRTWTWGEWLWWHSTRPLTTSQHWCVICSRVSCHISTVRPKSGWVEPDNVGCSKENALLQVIAYIYIYVHMTQDLFLQ